MSTHPPAVADAYRRRYRVAGFLALVYTLNFMDRQVVSVLQEPIKHELGLSDTQLGLLSGLSFALFYTAFGIPVARASDRWRRNRIMAAACLAWSLCTAACGLARSFGQLALARVLVGVGEAGGSPPSYSLLSDHFPPRERATGLAIYSLGVPIGSALGVAAGGAIAARFGWRAAFVCVGLPGLLLAALLPLVVREPVRGGLDPTSATVPAARPLGAGLRAFARDPVMTRTAVAAGLSSFVGYAMLAWNPSFLLRVKGMALADVAGWYSLVLGATGVAGTVLSGALADRLSRRDPRWYGWLSALTFALGMPAFAGLLLAPTPRLAMLFITALALLSTMYLAPALAVVQNAAPPGERGLAGAVLLFILNLIGLGGGPVFVGKASDLAAAAGVQQPLLVAYAALLPVIALTVLVHLMAAAAMGGARAQHSGGIHTGTSKAAVQGP